MTQTENIAAARLLLKKMGVDPADLLQDPAAAPEIPTFADYIPRVSRAVSAGTRRLYTTYWNRVVDAWGPRLITEPSPLEISQFAEDIKANVVHRRNARGGLAAAEHLIGALRCMYNHAVADGFLPEAENPAARVPKPRRPPASRMALPDGRLAEISAVAASTGDDPALDALIIRLHSETACRRGGALALTPEDLDPGHCLIRLREKGGTERWQPVSPTLMTHLLAHAESRGGLDSGDTAPAVRDGQADHRPPVRLPLEPPGRAPAVGQDSAGHHALDTAHDLDLGRAPFRFRRRAGVRRAPGRCPGRTRHVRDRHLRPRRAARGRNRARCPDGRVPPPRAGRSTCRRRRPHTLPKRNRPLMQVAGPGRISRGQETHDGPDQGNSAASNRRQGRVRGTLRGLAGLRIRESCYRRERRPGRRHVPRVHVCTRCSGKRTECGRLRAFPAGGLRAVPGYLRASRNERARGRRCCC